jgi:hypothetical protein
MVDTARSRRERKDWVILWESSEGGEEGRVGENRMTWFA